VYDGELVAGDGRTENRTGITGHVNRILKGTSTSIKDYTYVIFDYMTFDDWYSKQSSMPYSERHARLNEFYISDKNIRYIDLFELRTLDHVNEIFSDHIRRGFEGLILRYPEDPYMWTRSEKLIKKKAINEFILKCVDVTEGTGKYKGMIGALICEGIVEGKEVKVKIGSGLSAFDVDQHPSTYIGKNIEGLYNTVVKSDNNQYHSLFLPRFKRISGRMDV
jgi:DNA ligase-1